MTGNWCTDFIFCQLHSFRLKGTPAHLYRPVYLKMMWYYGVVVLTKTNVKRGSQ